MFRFLKYFNGISFQKKRIHVASTGAAIEIDRHFRHDFWAVVRIYLYFIRRDLGRFFKGAKPAGTIAFHPQTPGPWYNIWQVTRLAGLKIESDVTKSDYVFIFEDKTISEYDKTGIQNSSKPKLNHRIDDISKTHVADIFEEVFGYALRIDPLTHRGPAVQKSNGNGKHDGVVVKCPINTAGLADGQIYQRLVDSTYDGETSEDLRIAYALGEIALVYHKHKPLYNRFGTHYLSVDVRDAADVFSPEEIKLITEFCEKMCLDFGAIDVMRDKHDDRIYIVDVNKTCMPVLCLPLKDQIRCQQKIADALSRGIMRLS